MLSLLFALGISPNASGRAPDGFWDKLLQSFATQDKANATGKGGVVFVGSSSIRLWPIARSFPGLRAVNRGLGGARIDDVNHYVERLVLPYEPKVVVFYAGENDLGGGATPERVLSDYRAFVGLVQARLPAARIVFISIKPSPVLRSHWPKVREANRLIGQFCEGDKRLRFVDVTTAMIGAAGRPRDDLFNDDGLHMNAEGYRLWTRIVTPVVEAALSEP